MDQLVKHNLIDERKFGIFTRMKNMTDINSQIRFGGFNEALYKDRHSVQWMPTTGIDTWKIEVW